jgi:hypothetical protein
MLGADMDMIDRQGDTLHVDISSSDLCDGLL